MDEQAGWTVGYVRVSSIDQNVERQLAVFDDLPKERVFVDKVSGKDRHRPELKRMLQTVRTGDTVRVKSVDRLARSTRDLLDIANELRDKGVKLVFVDTPALSLDSAEGEFVMTILGALAQMERRVIRERQNEGIAIAKAAGKYDRENSLTPEQVAEARKRVADGVPKAKVARDFGVSRTTMYDALDGKGAYSGEEYELDEGASEG